MDVEEDDEDYDWDGWGIVLVGSDAPKSDDAAEGWTGEWPSTPEAENEGGDRVEDALSHELGLGSRDEGEVDEKMGDNEEVDVAVPGACELVAVTPSAV